MRIANNLILILILLSATFQSCWVVDDDNINAICSSDCTTIQGKFTTKDGNTPVGDMRLEFDWSITGVSGLSGRIRKIAVTQTDDNGNYKILFFANEEELTTGHYLMRFYVPDNSYITRQNHAYFEIGINKRDTIVTRNYHIPKKGATINVKITNPEALTEDDNMVCNLSYKFDDLSKQIRYGVGSLFSQYSSEGTYSTAAGQYTYIQVLKKKNGEYFNNSDSVKIGLNEIVNYEVEF